VTLTRVAVRPVTTLLLKDLAAAGHAPPAWRVAGPRAEDRDSEVGRTATVTLAPPLSPWLALKTGTARSAAPACRWPAVRHPAHRPQAQGLRRDDARLRDGEVETLTVAFAAVSEEGRVADVPLSPPPSGRCRRLRRRPR